MPETLYDRRRLNEEIERAYINTSLAVVAILMYRQTEQGMSDIDLYTQFYNAFTYLVLLTADLPSIRDAQENEKPIVITAIAFIDKKVNIDNMKDVIRRCEEGAAIFNDYKKLLINKGIIALLK